MGCDSLRSARYSLGTPTPRRLCTHQRRSSSLFRPRGTARTVGSVARESQTRARDAHHRRWKISRAAQSNAGGMLVVTPVTAWALHLWVATPHVASITMVWPLAHLEWKCSRGNRWRPLRGRRRVNTGRLSFGHLRALPAERQTGGGESLLGRDPGCVGYGGGSINVCGPMLRRTPPGIVGFLPAASWRSLRALSKGLASVLLTKQYRYLAKVDFLLKAYSGKEISTTHQLVVT